MNDEAAMALALAEAVKAVGRTHPNPAVGAVIVRGDRIVGRGFTSPPGGPHAEIAAIREAGAKAKGATIVCTLEPCSHTGRTGPCADAIIKAGLSRVVFAAQDPNPLVNGKGAKRLRAAGLDVRAGVMASAAEELNRPFFHFFGTGRPWITLKVGMTLDGKIATETGRSKWITSDASRLRAHHLRDRVDAIVVGAGTVKADDPQLTVRVAKRRPGPQPLRVVLDPSARSSRRAKIFQTRDAPTLLVTEDPRPSAFPKGVEVHSMPSLELEPLMRELARRGVRHVLVEGGAQTHRQFLEAGLVDELVVFMAPVVFGHGGLTWSGALQVDSPQKAPRLTLVGVDRLGDDVMVTLRIPSR